jgi:hypothetical protein
MSLLTDIDLYHLTDKDMYHFDIGSHLYENTYKIIGFEESVCAFNAVVYPDVFE